MLRAIRFVLVLGVLAATFAPGLVPVRQVYACSCAYAPDPADLRLADLVFAGTVLDVRSADRGASSATLIPVTFAADHVWLGEAAPLTIVRTETSGAACGYTFHPGERYLVYARELHVSLCSPTRPFDDASVELLERVTGAGKTIRAPAPTGTGGYRPGFTTSPHPEGGGWGDRAAVLGLAAGFIALGAAAAIARRDKAQL